MRNRAVQSQSTHSHIPAPQDSLRTRLVTVFVLLAIAPLLLGSLILLVASVALTQREITEGQEYVALTIAQNLDHSWNDMRSNLSEIALLLNQKPTADQRTAPFLFQQDCPACRHIWVVAADGQLIAQTAPVKPLPPMTPERFRALFETEQLTQLEMAGDGHTMLISLPIANQSSQVLIAELDVQLFAHSVLLQASAYRQAYAYIVDPTGRLLATTDPDRAAPGQDTLNLPLVRAATRQADPPHNQAYRGLLEMRVTGVWSQMSETGWYVLVEAPLITTTMENWTFFGIEAALLVATGGIAIILGRRLATTITRPLEQLSQGVDRLRTGSWDPPRVVARDDEIGHLALAFRDMAQELQRQQLALRSQADELILANDGLHAAVLAEHRANTLKSRFVATISHELRTPLTAILGYTELLTAGVYGPIEEEQCDVIRRVNGNGTHLLQLINDLLDFSKLEAGKLEVVESSVGLSDLIATIVNTGFPQAQLKGLTLTATISPRTPPIVYLDPLRVRQILLNLIFNAIKFTEHGSVRLEVHSEPLHGSSPPRELLDSEFLHTGMPQRPAHLVFVVEDMGIGIAPEDQASIFQEFHQVDARSTRHFPGAGLGLAITERLVRLMGGTIHVTSQLGVGSRFTVTLPVISAVDSLDTAP